MSHLDQLIDAHGRAMRDLRISVTDRCNLRCLYCLPETEAERDFHRTRWGVGPSRSQAVEPIRRPWIPRSQILTFEEIERVARILAPLGIEKIRLTGGEPLLRQELEHLVERLARIGGVRDLAMTTNGFSFLKRGRALKEAGLRRVSFSLDSLDRQNFMRMTGRDGLEGVLASIEHAQELGLNPVKVNAVIVRGYNDEEIEALAAFGRERGVRVRFIEFMPLDSSRAWSLSMVVPGQEILSRIQACYALQAIPQDNPSETAKRWALADGSGEIGIIASVTEPFCGQCNRLRLTADGQVRTCLFSSVEHDLRALLRGGSSDAQIGSWLEKVVLWKEEAHRIGRTDFVSASRSMSCIGG